MTEIRLGRRVLRDPSGLEREITGYEAFLDKKFQEAKEELLEVVGGTGDVIKPVDAAMDRLLEASKGRVEENVQKAQQTGFLRSNQFMLAAGIVSARAIPPDAGLRLDAQATQVLEQRNLAALKGITDETAKVLKDELTAGILAGEGSHELAKRVESAVDGIGIARARTMARTETMFAFNTAAKANYARHGVNEVEWLVAKLKGLCEECDALDGKKFPINEAPDIPKHPRCKCILLPVIPEVAAE